MIARLYFYNSFQCIKSDRETIENRIRTRSKRTAFSLLRRVPFCRDTGYQRYYTLIVLDTKYERHSHIST